MHARRIYICRRVAERIHTWVYVKFYIFFYGYRGIYSYSYLEHFQNGTPPSSP
jgi:hypothetical protein